MGYDAVPRLFEDAICNAEAKDPGYGSFVHANDSCQAVKSNLPIHRYLGCNIEPRDELKIYQNIVLQLS